MRLIQAIDSGLKWVHGVILDALCRWTGEDVLWVTLRTSNVVFIVAAATGFGSLGLLASESISYNLIDWAESYQSLMTSMVVIGLLIQLSKYLGPAIKSAEGTASTAPRNLPIAARLAIELCAVAMLLTIPLYHGAFEIARGPVLDAAMLAGTAAVSYFLDKPSGGHPFKKALEWIKSHRVRVAHPIPT